MSVAHPPEIGNARQERDRQAAMDEAVVNDHVRKAEGGHPCAYADREMEFGITTLFGGFSERFWSAYQETWPLPAGWRERNPLYQLYHLLNHHLLFGGGYGAQALRIARRLVG